MKQVKILLADDHKWVRAGFKLALETTSTKNFKIIGEAADGIEAVDLNKQLRPDLILMDINMPNMNGIDAAKEIRKLDENVRIIILTMLDNERFIFEALSTGINGYIYKDAEISELKTAIGQVMEGEDYYNKEVTRKILNFHMGKTVSQFHDSEQKKNVLTKRELEILILVSEGLTSKAIAEKLFISPYTVVKHRKNIIKKLELKNFNEVVRYAIMNGLILSSDS